MNDLIPAWLRNSAYLLTASLFEFLVYKLEGAHLVAGLVAKAKPGWHDNIAMALSPLGGASAAEILSSRWVWNHFPKGIRSWLWKLLQCGTPDMSGVWEVTWISNDSINEALLNAYRGEGTSAVVIEQVQRKEYQGKLVLIVTPVEVSVRLHKARVTEANNSTVARLYQEANGDVVLTYQAMPTVPQAAARDSPTYNFAARLIYHPEEGGELRGSYHTDRGKWFGQNAAGEIILRRAT